MRIFALLMQSNRALAESVRYDYEEFIDEMNKYFYQYKTMKGFLEYIEKAKPNNYWVYAASGVIDGLRSMHGDKLNDYIKKFVEDFVKRKISGKDIQ